MMQKKTSENSLFPLASTYPEFFDNNLVDDSRVIKVFRGPQAFLRAFYYQVFKLALELEYRTGNEDDSEDQDAFVDYSNSLLDIIASYSSAVPSISKDIINIQRFIQQMQNSTSTDFEIHINQNTHIDKSMINILVAMLGIHPRQDLQDQIRIIQYLQKLSDIFQLTSQIYDRCVKFQQSDVFLYIENCEEIYAAYMDFDDQENQSNTNSRNQYSLEKNNENQPQQEKQLQEKTRGKEKISLPEFSKDQYQNQSNDISLDNVAIDPKTSKNKDPNIEKRRMEKQNNDTLINIVGDMLMSSKGDSKISNSFMTNHLNNSANIQLPVTPVRKGRDYSPPQNYPRIQEKISDQQINHNKRQSIKSAEGDESHVQTFKYSNNFQRSGHNMEDIFYNPQKPKVSDHTSNLHTISEVTASKESVFHGKNRRKDPLDYDNEEEKGTFYRQFTNTRILSMLPEPHRTKVKMLKNRFVGVHGSHRQNIRHF